MVLLSPVIRATDDGRRSDCGSGRRALGLRGVRPRGSTPQPVTELVRGDRTAEVVALCDVATEPAQVVPGRFGLDALGDDLETEVACEVDRRADDDGIVLVLQHRHHEGA